MLCSFSVGHSTKKSTAGSDVTISNFFKSNYHITFSVSVSFLGILIKQHLYLYDKRKSFSLFSLVNSRNYLTLMKRIMIEILPLFSYFLSSLLHYINFECDRFHTHLLLLPFTSFTQKVYKVFVA